MSSAASFSDVSDQERSILEALNTAELNIERRTALAAVIDEPYPPVEATLLQRGLIREVGSETQNESGERVTYRRFKLTDEGEQVLAWDERQSDSTPASVEPTRRPAKPAPEHERLSWTELSESVDEFETRSVASDDEHGEIRVTLAHKGEEWTAAFTQRAWFQKTGCRAFRDQYHSQFGTFPSIDEREFGILQTRWVDHFAEQIEANDSDDEQAEADAEQVEADDSDDEQASQPKTQKERAKEYLSGEGADDSIRAAAEALDVSVGTVQNAKSELNADSDE